MSVRLMTAVWQLDLPSHLKLVLLAVADHANDDGWAYPGQSSLAAKCSLSERQVRANLADLADRGLLEVTQRGRTRTNLYRVTPDRQPTADQGEGGDRQPTATPDRRPTAAMTGGPPPNQGTISEPSDRTVSRLRPQPHPADLAHARHWAQLRQVPATDALLATWAAQVADFVKAGGQVTDQLLQRAHARGIEQPSGWAFVVEGVQPPWPAWLPGYLLDAVQHPDRPVDPRWERSYSYGPHSQPPPDRLAAIRAKAALQRQAAAMRGQQGGQKAITMADVLAALRVEHEKVVAS